MAVSDGEQVAVVVSCDLVFVTRELTAEVRRQVRQEVALDDTAIMVHATHTHSGPSIRTEYRNAYDPPWMELLPRRIAQACCEAVRNLQDAVLRHAEVPCEGMATNRVHGTYNFGRQALRDGFRPDPPESTDSTCHVLEVIADGRRLGFASYFGCHNVVGGSGSTYIHGDYAGIATGLLEHERPGTVGLFLQGAEGDINAAACVFGDDEVLEALDVMAGRYARAVGAGLVAAQPLEDGSVRVSSRKIRFSRRDVPPAELRKMLAAEQSVIDNREADDADIAFRMAILRRHALQDILARVERGESFENEVEVQGIQFGPVALLGAPLEIFHAVKNDVVAQAKAPIPLVLSLTNDEQGYAPDREAAAGKRGYYEAMTVPLWKHTLPYADIHGELVRALLAVDADLASTA